MNDRHVSGKGKEGKLLKSGKKVGNGSNYEGVVLALQVS
jgi:hypothetical protein